MLARHRGGRRPDGSAAAFRHQGRRDAGPTPAKGISATIRPFLGDQHRAPLGAESASKQGLQRQMRLHAGGPEVVFAPEITRFGRELETADAVRRQPCVLMRCTEATLMPGGLGHGGSGPGGALCGSEARRERRAIRQAISAWEPQYLCTPSEQHERGRNWFVVPLPVTLMRMFFPSARPAPVAAGPRGARHAAVRATLCLLALMLIPATARGRDNDIPRDGITAAIPAGWILLPPDPSRPGKQLVAPDGEGWLVVDATPADGDVAARMNAYASRDGERVTYHKRGGSWIVVSGFRGDDRIFYRKAMLACSNTRWHEIEFEYPAAQKRAYDRFVTQASHRLGAHRNEGCAASRASR